jgi:hypothetical protein
VHVSTEGKQKLWTSCCRTLNYFWDGDIMRYDGPSTLHHVPDSRRESRKSVGESVTLSQSWLNLDDHIFFALKG